jgi:serine/threonine protein kinase
MARVYEARLGGLHGFEKHLAIKMMLPEYAGDKEFVTMLIDEAKIAVALNHSNICQIHDLGCIENRYYIAMEYVEGADLNKVVNTSLKRRVTIPYDVIAQIGQDICAGLDYAHSKTDHNGKPLHIIHRDISPANILISMSGEVKIVDFGVAKATSRSQQTTIGVVKGKYQYMSPEQVTGAKIDHRSDIFAVGIVLYETVAGRMLYPDGPDMLDRIRLAKRRPLTQLRPDVPPELDVLISKALSRKAKDRYQHAGELGEALAEFRLTYQSQHGRGRLEELMMALFGKPAKPESPPAEEPRPAAPPPPAKSRTARAPERADTARGAAPLSFEEMVQQAQMELPPPEEEPHRERAKPSKRQSRPPKKRPEKVLKIHGKEIKVSDAPPEIRETPPPKSRPSKPPVELPLPQAPLTEEPRRSARPTKPATPPRPAPPSAPLVLPEPKPPSLPQPKAPTPPQPKAPTPSESRPLTLPEPRPPTLPEPRPTPPTWSPDVTPRAAGPGAGLAWVDAEDENTRANPPMSAPTDGLDWDPEEEQTSADPAHVVSPVAGKARGRKKSLQLRVTPQPSNLPPWETDRARTEERMIFEPAMEPRESVQLADLSELELDDDDDVTDASEPTVAVGSHPVAHDAEGQTDTFDVPPGFIDAQLEHLEEPQPPAEPIARMPVKVITSPADQATVEVAPDEPDVDIDIDLSLMGASRDRKTSGYFLVRDPAGVTSGPFSRAQLYDMSLSGGLSPQDLAVPAKGANALTMSEGAVWVPAGLYIGDSDTEFEAQISLQLATAAKTYELAVEPPPRIFLEMASARSSGVLVFDRPGVHKEVTLNQGHPTYASSSLPDEQLGKRLLRLGLLSPTAFTQALAAVLAEHKTLGEVVVQRGLVKQHAVDGSMERLVRSRLLELFQPAWATGHAAFHPGAVDAAPLDLFVEPLQLVKEGVQSALGPAGPAGWVKAREASTFMLSGESDELLRVLGVSDSAIEFLGAFRAPLRLGEALELAAASGFDRSGEELSAAVLLAVQVAFLAAVTE